jgi:predicted regulator of Ras-like GTPase activity (Roadblock/LC7/MglB family)
LIESVFGTILRQLVEGHPEIIGAIFAAWDGEMVDLYHRDADGAFEVQTLGAHLGIMVKRIQRAHTRVNLGGFQELSISTDRAIYIVVPVTDDYYIGLWSTSGAPLGWAKRRIEMAVHAIRKEM